MKTTLDSNRPWILALIAAAGLGLAAAARAQEPAEPRDDALDSLLEKLGGQEPKEERKGITGEGDPAPRDKSVDDAAKPDKPAAKPAEVSTEDQAIDDLLEKLGATRDEPTAEDRPKPPGGGRKPPGEPDRGDPGLSDKDKQIDERLEELTGRKRKRNQDDPRSGEASGPMGGIVKEMRDVEERLGKPDTGEDTQSKQKEIVKRLETLIQQIRQSGSGSGKASKEIRQAGVKPGDQPGDQPGANASGAPMSKPAKPTDKHAVAGGKDAWGHLPPELRQELDNLFKEDALPAAQELIRRYYLSVSRKKLVRGE